MDNRNDNKNVKKWHDTCWMFTIYYEVWYTFYLQFNYLSNQLNETGTTISILQMRN